MMCKLQIKTLLAGLVLAVALGEEARAQSSASRPPECTGPVSKAEANSLTAYEIVARAEERVEALRAKLFDLDMQEINLHIRLDDIDLRSTPEGMQRVLVFFGSPRPLDELRDALRTRLENERARVNKQLEFLASSRERLEAAIREADAELERVRQRLSSQ